MHMAVISAVIEIISDGGDTPCGGENRISVYFARKSKSWQVVSCKSRGGGAPSFFMW